MPLRGAAEAAAAWDEDVCRFQRQERPRVEAPAAAPPIVLLPGFGNCTQDYVAPFGDEEAGVAAALQVTCCRHLLLLIYNFIPSAEGMSCSLCG